MTQVNIELNNCIGKIKPMNAVNNGPTTPSRMFSKSSNFDYYSPLVSSSTFLLRAALAEESLLPVIEYSGRTDTTT